MSTMPPTSSATHDAVETIFTPEQIAARIDQLAEMIAKRNLPGLVVVPILKGSFVFAADLIRALCKAGVSPEVDFLTLSSYRKATSSSGTVSIVRDLETDVAGRHVLLVDDILESGRTLAFAKDLVSARGAVSVSTCVLLEKPGFRAVTVGADYKAFDCPPVFVVGYGMDVANRYRELPFVGKLTRK